ncbi:esterase-like activity of phytase family protein [Ekhidna sp.]
MNKIIFLFSIVLSLFTYAQGINVKDYAIIDTASFNEISGLSGIEFLDGNWHEGANFVAVTDIVNKKIISRKYDLTFKYSNGEIFLVKSSFVSLKSVNAESIRRTPKGEFIASEMKNQKSAIFQDSKVIFQDNKKVRKNTGFESLAFDGENLFTAMERADRDNGSTQIYKFTADGEELGSFHYKVEELISNGGDRTGITEMLYLQDDRFLILEREWNEIKGKNSFVQTRLKQIRLKRGMVEQINGLDLDLLLLNEGINDNFEGITWGPDIEGFKKGHNLVLVSDDNGGKDDDGDGKPDQKTWIVLLGIRE